MTKIATSAKKAYRNTWFITLADATLSLMGGQFGGSGIEVPSPRSQKVSSKNRDVVLTSALVVSVGILLSLVSFVLWNKTVETQGILWGSGACVLTIVSVFFLILPIRVRTLKRRDG